ncbi:tripartite tricarboxylate transporter substrate binding protein [Muricoccus radiodurans]|uniref:tripartite tricarboxylate transporter substrate binding protein n=1 Tax=Muricoccus radiodurans TaxID=2231721 RepID=UPI003CF3EC04
MTSRRIVLAAPLAALAMPAIAQTRGPVRIIVPFVPGGNTDLVARNIAEKLGPVLGTQVVVENRSGAGGAVGTEAVARATPDGTTMLFHTCAVAIEPSLRRDISYDARRDLTPVTQIAETPFLFMVSNPTQARTVRELIDLAKARPGRLNYGTAGTGSSGHLALADFCVQAGIQMTHVPYRGAAPYLLALSTDEVQLVMDPASTAKPLADSGRIRGLATSTAERAPAWPELPTISESGLPGFAVNIWHGLFAPANTPAAITARLNAAVRQVMAGDGMRQWADGLGFRIVTQEPEPFRAFFLDQVEHWAGIVRRTGVTME